MEHHSAAESVLRLLSNTMLPETGQLPILYQAVPLLERQELPPLFSLKDTSQLLAHLQVTTSKTVSRLLERRQHRPGSLFLRLFLIACFGPMLTGLLKHARFGQVCSIGIVKPFAPACLFAPVCMACKVLSSPSGVILHVHILALSASAAHNPMWCCERF